MQNWNVSYLLSMSLFSVAA